MKLIYVKKMVIYIEKISVKSYNVIEAKGFNYLLSLFVILLTNNEQINM